MADCYRGDKRATESKQQLRKALFQLLKEKEWGKISVQDLTNKAGIHRTTFYQHYEDKFDLAQQVMDEMFDVMKTAILLLYMKVSGRAIMQHMCIFIAFISICRNMKRSIRFS